MVLDPSCTAMEAIGTTVCETVKASEELLPSLVAEIVADPTDTAVTRPVIETVATLEFELA